jgi:hypothetical protein
MLLFALACITTQNDDLVGEASAGCDRSESSLALDEVSAAGFAPADVLAWLEGEHAAPIALAGESATRDLSVTVSSDGTATWVDLEPAESSGGIEPALAAWCEDGMELGATVAFATSTGDFDESWPVALSVSQVAATSASVERELSGLSGTYTVPAGSADGCDTASLSFEMSFSELGGASGELALLCEATDGETASMSRDVLATWGEGEFE